MQDAYGSIICFITMIQFFKNWYYLRKFYVSRSFFMNWAKNWKVLIWFKRKNKNFRDFRVFDFALYPRSKTRKSRKFFFTLNYDTDYNSRFENIKKVNWDKTERFQYDLEQKGKFPRFLSFWFCSIPKIENSEVSENSLLIQILTV